MVSLYVLLYNKTMSLRRQWPLVILFVFAFVAFIFRGVSVPDPDFGWHIRNGENILEHGIPTTDPFSYSMPSYPFVDHEWLTNLLWAKTYNQWGMLPLVLSGALLAVASLLFQTILVKKKFVTILVFLAAGTFFEFVGARPQVTTWFFLSFLLCILFDQHLWQRWRFLLPLIFLLWANLHGGFGIGLGVLGIVLLGRSLEERKLVKEKLLVLSLCILATLINPYGIHLWWEFFMQLTDTQLRWTIYEWYPAFYFTNFAFWIYFSLSLFVITRYRKHYAKTELFVYCFLLLEGLASMRNIPLWVISSFLLTARGIALLQKDAAKYKFGEQRFRIAYKAFFVIAMGLFLPQIGLFFYGTVVLKENQHFYPRDAVIYLREHKRAGQIFTQYDWGGYMDWQLPEKKVFVDGRMPSWRWNANKPGESNYAFEEYKNVMSGRTAFEPFVEKYHITTLLIPKSQLSQPTMKILGFTIQQNSFMQKIFFSELTFYKVTQEAKALGWHETYSDETTVILEKPETIHQNNGS